MDTCGTCINYQPGEGDNGLCFRYPPVPFGIPAQNPSAIATPGAPPNVGVITVSMRPTVTRTTPACGEYDPPDNDGQEGA